MNYKWMPTAVVMMAALVACGDDGDDGGDDASPATETTAVITSEIDPGTGTSGGTVETFCEEYRTAQANAENPASTDQFRDLTPPDELAEVWEDYLDSDWDAGTTVDTFVAENCF